MAWTRDGQHRDCLVGLEREARRLDAFGEVDRTAAKRNAPVAPEPSSFTAI